MIYKDIVLLTFLAISFQITSGMGARKRPAEHMLPVLVNGTHSVPAEPEKLEVPVHLSPFEMARGMKARHLQYPLLKKILWAAALYTVTNEESLKALVRAKAKNPLLHRPTYREVMEAGKNKLAASLEKIASPEIAQDVDVIIQMLSARFKKSDVSTRLTKKRAYVHHGNIDDNLADLELAENLVQTITHFCQLTNTVLAEKESEFLEKSVYYLIEARLKKSYPPRDSH